MKKAAIVLSMMVLLAISLPVFAQEFPDVPPDHWAYQAVQELVNAGIVQGYPDGTYGGKRAMTRYEFAEAVAKAIPVLEEMIGKVSGPKGDKGDTGPAGPAGTPGVSAEQLAAMQKLIDEFRDELAALGVDVEALRRDVAALCERVTALEQEVARVRFTGVADLIGRGEVRNSVAPIADIDSRYLSVGSSAADQNNPLANSEVFADFDFNVKGRVSDNASVNATLVWGNYLNFVLNRAGDLTTSDNLQDLAIWNLNFDGAVKLGPLGAAQVVVGRQPLQLTPSTLKFVDPDSYTGNAKLDSGDYVVDGGRATFNMGKMSLSLFAAKAGRVAQQWANNSNLMSPNLMIGNVTNGQYVPQIAGARAVIGTPLNGNLGLTYYEAGLAPTVGRARIYGADLNLMFANVGLGGEYAKFDPNKQMKALPIWATPGGDDNDTWNAKLSYNAGRLGIGAGYCVIGENYIAPGYWLRTGRAVNLTNIKGTTANLSYALGNRLSIAAEGQFLMPDKAANTVFARSAIEQGRTYSVAGAALDTVTYWKAGLKYGLTSVNSVDLGWEEAVWKPTAGLDTKERYISIGLGHTFNANAGMKLLYQIVDFTAGSAAANPYGDATGRGGVAAAEFQMKY